MRELHRRDIILIKKLRNLLIGRRKWEKQNQKRKELKMELIMKGKNEAIDRDEILKDLVIFRSKHKVETVIDWEGDVY